jgi:hypothetical protein
MMVVRLPLSARADILQQPGESFQARSGHMAELALVKLANRLIETFQNGEAGGSYTCLDDTAVVGLALAGDEAALLHAIEKAGHIRVVGNHALADRAAGQAFGLRAAKDAENVVLSSRKAVGFQKLFSFEAEGVGGFLEGDEHLRLEGWRWRLAGAATHEVRIVVVTTGVKRKICHRAERVPASGFVKGAQLNLADKALRALRNDHFDGVSDVVRHQSL